MEIEFSPSQLPAPRAGNSLQGTAAQSRAVEQTPPLQGMAELQSKLDALALTRPNKMEALQPIVADVQYPPDELLNGIAHLLAIHLTE